MAWNISGYNGFDNLSKRERECLRGVALLKTSKEIAQELGISRHTVDKHLKSAMLALNASSRFDAAHIFTAAEADAAGPPEQDDSGDLADIGYIAPDYSPESGLKGTNGGDIGPQPGPKGTNGWYYQSQTLADADNRGSFPDRPSDGAARNAAAEARRKAAGGNTPPRVSAIETATAPLSAARLISVGGGYDLTPLQKLCIIAASALCLLILISTSLSSLASLTQLCRNTSLCDGATVLNHSSRHSTAVGDKS